MKNLTKAAVEKQTNENLLKFLSTLEREMDRENDPHKWLVLTDQYEMVRKEVLSRMSR